MSAVNKVILIGRLTADPEARFTEGGHAVTNFTLAVDRNFKNNKGEKETDFIKCVAWRKTAELVTAYLKKGNLTYIEGAMQNSSWEQDGVKKYKTEVQVNNVTFLPSASKGGEGGNSSGDSKPASSEFDHMPVDDFTTDDIPF